MGRLERCNSRKWRRGNQSNKSHHQSVSLAWSVKILHGSVACPVKSRCGATGLVGSEGCGLWGFSVGFCRAHEATG